VLNDPGTVSKEYEGQQTAPVCDTALPTEVVTPQPELPICPHCSADVMFGLNNDKLYMSIDPSYQGSISNAILLLKNNWGTTTAITLDHEAIDALNDSSMGVVVLTFNAPVNTKSAAVSFTLGAVSQSSPVALRYL
jgi:hypothetical protein